MEKIPKTKVCITCEKQKPRKEFYNKRSAKDGKMPYCKVCDAERKRGHYKENTEKFREKNRRYYKKNAEKVQECVKRYRQKNTKKLQEYQRRYYQENTEKFREKNRRYQKENREKIRKYENKKRKENINYRLARQIRDHLRRAIKRGATKNSSSLKYLGCSICKLKKHLERQFHPGMTWDNWSKDGWHIDHIRPLASFDLTDEKQLRKACHYTNLQPMWAKENLKKGARVA